MEVKIKKLSDKAITPTYAKDGDAGLDLTATKVYFDEWGNFVAETDICVEFPKGYAGKLHSRSSISKYDLILVNGTGLIDQGYRGQLIFKFKPLQYFGTNGQIIHYDFEPCLYQVGDKVGQLVLEKVETANIIMVDELSHTDRGTGGFGSTDPITKSIEDNC